ncbi:unnamed protein product [Allacma fusca]|uniref:Uncharacterized protein n=1 Tax=Allacma fusca TaxID=39272 RepID=A0A8J2K941_9HEXA|nr:unnamed protein product [Allacma fusca]
MMEIDDESGISAEQLRIQTNMNNLFGGVSSSEHDPLSPTTSSTSTFTSMASRGRSKVWNEFVVAPDGKKVICRLCGDSLSYSNSHSTSSMLKHLKRKHRMDLYPPTDDETSKSNASLKTNDKTKKSNKVKRVTTITNTAEVEPEPSIQHGPLVFTESCVRMRWTDHSEAFVGTFSRLYSDECYTDVTLVAEKIFFKAHRVILSSASEYFDDMFKMTPAGQHPIIFLKDVKAMDLRILLDFIYKGEIAIPPSLINELVRIGSEMKVRGLCDFQWNDTMKSSVMNINQPANVQVAQPQPSAPQVHQMPVVEEQNIQPTPILAPVQTQTVSSFSSLYNTFPSTSTVTNVAPGGATMASKLISSARVFTKQQVQAINPPIVTKTLNLQPTNFQPILTSAAAPNKVGIGTSRFDIGAGPADDTNATDLNSNPTVLMVTNEGETVLSTSQGAVKVVPHSESLERSTKTEAIDPHSQHLEGHPITLVSHHLGGTTEDLDEVVYSITTSVTGPHGEVLMSNAGEGEVPDTETIVVYGTGEEMQQDTACEDKKPDV